MKFAKLALLASTLAAAPYAAQAQDAGTTIYSQVDDSVVGKIESNDGTTAILDTGDYKAPLPVNYLAERPVGDAGENAWTINATKDQIDSMMAAQLAEAEAKLNAALVQDAAIVSADSQPAGMVLAIDDGSDQVIVENDAGIVSLKREHFALNAEGKLTALFTLEQLTGFTTEVPEGAEIRTASGTLIRAAGGTEMESQADVDASASR